MLTAIRILELTLQHDVFKPNDRPILNHVEEEAFVLFTVVLHVKWVFIPFGISWVLEDFHLFRLEKRWSFHIVLQGH